MTKDPASALAPEEFELVVIESPYKGDVERNITYARHVMRQCLLRGQAPFASHLLYTQPGVLRDDDPYERRLGMNAGIAWGAQAESRLVANDLGVSDGMHWGADQGRKLGQSVEEVSFGTPAYAADQRRAAFNQWVATFDLDAEATRTVYTAFTAGIEYALGNLWR